MMAMEKICPICGIKFKARYRSERKKFQKFCSKECSHKAHRRKYVCAICGSEFTLQKNKVANGGHKGLYCSKNCFHESQKGKRVSIKSEFKKGIRHSTATEFKKGENTGKNHPNWKGGVTSEHDKIRRTGEYKQWRNAVYERDYWTCQKCGKHCDAKDIAAHHIKSFADYPQYRFDINNGITYCRGCHLALHNKLRNSKKCALAI